MGGVINTRATLFNQMNTLSELRLRDFSSPRETPTQPILKVGQRWEFTLALATEEAGMFSKI